MSLFYIRVVLGKIEFYPAHTWTTRVNFLLGSRGCKIFVLFPKSRKRNLVEGKIGSERKDGGRGRRWTDFKKIKSFPNRRG